MKRPSLRHRLRHDILFHIGLAWLALLAVPALVQIVQGEKITTIGSPSHILQSMD